VVELGLVFSPPPFPPPPSAPPRPTAPRRPDSEPRKASEHEQAPGPSSHSFFLPLFPFLPLLFLSSCRPPPSWSFSGRSDQASRQTGASIPPFFFCLPLSPSPAAGITGGETGGTGGTASRPRMGLSLLIRDHAGSAGGLVHEAFAGCSGRSLSFSPPPFAAEDSSIEVI